MLDHALEPFQRLLLINQIPFSHQAVADNLENCEVADIFLFNSVKIVDEHIEVIWIGVNRRYRIRRLQLLVKRQ